MYKRQIPDPAVPTKDPFWFSSANPPISFDDTPDDVIDNNDRMTPEPDEPPDPNPGEPDSPPVPEPARAPIDPGLRQNDPPGPPRTRAAARAPGQKLPALPGIAHDRLPFERVLKRLKKVITPSDK